MKRLMVWILVLVTVCSCSKEDFPLKIGFSDWPGWVAWQIAIEKEWFKEEG